MISPRNVSAFLFLLLTNSCAADAQEATASSADEVTTFQEPSERFQTWVGIEGQQRCMSSSCSFRVRVTIKDDRGQTMIERCKTFVGSSGLGNMGKLGTTVPYSTVEITIEESPFQETPTPDLRRCVGTFDGVVLRKTSSPFDPDRDAELGADGTYRTTAVFEHRTSGNVVFRPGFIAIASWLDDNDEPDP